MTGPNISEWALRHRAFVTFSMVLLVGRADAPAEASSDEVQDAHLAHLADMHESGEMLAAGPVPGEGDVRIRGLCLFAVDAARAAELMAEDPAVRAGRFEVQVLLYAMGARQWLRLKARTAGEVPSITAVFAGADDGLYRSSDGGQSFTRLESPMNSREVWKIAVDPTNKQSLIWLAQAYQNSGNKAKAIEYYDRVLQLDPNEPNAKKGKEILMKGPAKSSTSAATKQ